MRPKERIKPMLKLIENAWIKYPDMRLGQLMVNIGMDWNWEMTEFSLALAEFTGEPIQEYLLRGSRGIDGRSKLKYDTISNLDIEHIKNILATQTLNEVYKKAFEEQQNLLLLK